jgi:[ribosomal protein S5]-alanine N-acetyltransferase
VESERLIYEKLQPEHLDSFHRLIRDNHVRRYLLDGEILPVEWSADQVRKSRALFELRGVGIWLVYIKLTNVLIGFCGFLEIPSVHVGPQLVYGMVQDSTGNGYATEMAHAAIAEAQRQGFATITASVDEVNAASLRVLEKLGFQRIEMKQGAFGNMPLLRLEIQSGM